MKTLVLLLVNLFFVYPASASAEKVMLNCEKKDFFYWGEPLRVKLLDYEGALVLRYTYQHGIASIGVHEVDAHHYAGMKDFVSAELKLVTGDYYSFGVKDTYDGLLGIGTTQVRCAKP